MEEKGMKKSLQILLIAFVFLALILGVVGGWYITDKYLGEDETKLDKEKEICEVCRVCPNDESIDSKFVGKYTGVSINDVSEDSVITIKADGTFVTNFNYCEGFFEYTGRVFVRQYASYDDDGNITDRVPVLTLLADEDDEKHFRTYQFEFKNNQLEMIIGNDNDGYDCSFATIFRK